MSKLSIEKIISINPYDDNDIKLIEEYENNNHLNNKLSNNIKKIRNTISKEKYLEKRKNSNEIEENLYIEKNSKIIGYCHLHGEKDIKSCKISFIFDGNNIKRRKAISMITEYIIGHYGMQEVFTSISSSDKETINALNIYGYENLGEENGEVLFLKEQEYYINLQRAIQ